MSKEKNLLSNTHRPSKYIKTMSKAELIFEVERQRRLLQNRQSIILAQQKRLIKLRAKIHELKASK